MSNSKDSKKTAAPAQDEAENEESKPIRCFVIMPFSSSDGYEPGHFTRVYNHIIKPACEKAGVIPERTDDGFESGFIPTKMLKMLTEYELAICDMSAVNANVFYELGVRQSFDLPVCLIKDEKSRRMFDVQGFASIEYHSSLRYDYVIDAVDRIDKGLRETYEKQQKGEIVNSIKHFLDMKVAPKPEQKEISQETAIILERLGEIERYLSLKDNSKLTPSSVKAGLMTGKTNKIEEEILRIKRLIDENNIEFAMKFLSLLLKELGGGNYFKYILESLGRDRLEQLLAFLNNNLYGRSGLNATDYSILTTCISQALNS
ncbi:hypothetical protein [Runella zeae]|uniref:hypothetical protein n=1 Tax=Runella zeae TaxID=94255 RepID=UPI00235649C3|nr:hypothetical protein [Runella zeae]